MLYKSSEDIEVLSMSNNLADVYVGPFGQHPSGKLMVKRLG